MERPTSSRRLSLRTRGLLALAAIVALFTMHGLAPSHSSASAAGDDVAVTHSGLHHLLEDAHAHAGAGSHDHHSPCADESCSSSSGDMAQLIEACIVALATALTFGLLRRRRVVVTPARLMDAWAGRVRAVRDAWPPPPPLLSELGISRT